MKNIYVISQFLCIAYLTFFAEFFAVDYLLIVQASAFIFGLYAVVSIGRNNWTIFPTPTKISSLSSQGAYALVRHPMYTAVLFFYLPVAIRTSSGMAWIVFILLGLTLTSKLQFEEGILAKKHPEYLAFKKQTRHRLIPFVW